MRFQVPQFIEVEDKIFGPLTFKQFVYLVGGAGAAVVLWLTLPRFIAILLGVPVLVLAGALAFYKVNGKPFSYMVEAFFKFYASNRLYLWKKREREVISSAPQEMHAAEFNMKQKGGSKLKDMSWNLDVSNKDETQTETWEK